MIANLNPRLATKIAAMKILPAMYDQVIVEYTPTEIIHPHQSHTTYLIILMT